MAVVDTYCEWLLKHKQDKNVIVLPDGLPEEQYLDHLDVLIKNMFSQLTVFSEADYRSGKAALQLVKKYCLAKQTYGIAPLTSEFSDYSKATSDMIDEEIKRLDSVSDGIVMIVNEEKLFTIIVNTLQLLTSIIHYYDIKKEERTRKENAKVVGVEIPLIKVDVQKHIPLEREDTSLVNPISYLEHVFAVNEKFEKSKSNGNAPRRIIGEWAEFKYLTMILELTIMKVQELEVV